jgi:predicted transcriptional regulator of viral defense system
MNKIFVEMYPKKLFTIAEARKIIKNYQVLKNNLKDLTSKNHLTRLKNGLYYINPLDNKEFYPDTIHIASKLRPDAIICANTALRIRRPNITLTDTSKQTVQPVAQAVAQINPNITPQAAITENNPKEPKESTLYIGSKHPAKLRIDKYTYKIIKNQTFGIETITYNTSYGQFEIKITDMEKTIIDCIKLRSVKFEDLLNIIRSRPSEINVSKIQNYLEKYNSPILYNKIGLIMQICKIQLKLSDGDIEKIHKKITKKIYYYKERKITLARPHYQYLKEWNIMLPENIFNIAKTIRPEPSGINN